KNRFSHCFVGETPVSTPDGPRRIDDLRVGDMVSTPDGPRRVTATMNRMAEVIELALADGRAVRCTPDHPFLVAGERVRADEVVTVETEAGGAASVVFVGGCPIPGEHRVYDLTVEDAHCFYANG